MKLWIVTFYDTGDGSERWDTVVAMNGKDAIVIVEERLHDLWGLEKDEELEVTNWEAYPLHEVDGYKITVEAKN